MEKYYSITYEFEFETHEHKRFEIRLDTDTITAVRTSTVPLPAWTDLGYATCSCCSLSPEQHERCPLAVNIADLVEEFKDVPSFDVCRVRCTTPERTYSKKTDVQEGLFSIFGIVMATSTCPEMNLFKPMARFHLPFATTQETAIRLTGFYFLRQYFRQQRGGSFDLSLQSLKDHYARVQQVNEGILRRIRQVARKDADRNAIVILNSLAQIMTMEIEDGLDSLVTLFPESDL